MSDEARPVLNAESHTDERRTRGPLRALGAMLRRTINRAREAIRVRLSRRGVEAPVGQVESLPAIQLAVEGTSRLLAANARLTTDWLPRREIPTTTNGHQDIALHLAIASISGRGLHCRHPRALPAWPAAASAYDGLIPGPAARPSLKTGSTRNPHGPYPATNAAPGVHSASAPRDLPRRTPASART